MIMQFWYPQFFIFLLRAGYVAISSAVLHRSYCWTTTRCRLTASLSFDVVVIARVSLLLFTVPLDDVFSQRREELVDLGVRRNMHVYCTSLNARDVVGDLSLRISDQATLDERDSIGGTVVGVVANERIGVRDSEVSCTVSGNGHSNYSHRESCQVICEMHGGDELVLPYQMREMERRIEGVMQGSQEIICTT